MSGSKQHYIPQSLLRGFGRRGKGKAIQVNVYTKGRGAFTTATEGVAAKRYFYSDKQTGPDTQTLDAEITTYESKLVERLRDLRAIVPGNEIDSGTPAEVVTHLCVRQAHLRDSLESAAGQILGDISGIFADKERLKKVMGLEGDLPGARAQKNIDKYFEQLKPAFAKGGLSETDAKKILFEAFKSEYDRLFAVQSVAMQGFIEEMSDRTGRMARDGHNEALETELVPAARIEALQRLDWRVESAKTDNLVLPDCIAVCWSTISGYQPLLYAGHSFDIVFMPLDHELVLVGERSDFAKTDVRLTNEVSALCSWDFFIARDRSTELEAMIPRIGERTRELINNAIESVAEKHI